MRKIYTPFVCIFILWALVTSACSLTIPGTNPEPTREAEVPAGGDFFAIETEETLDGWTRLITATNEGACDKQIVFKLDNGDVFAQFPECWVLNLTGTDTVTLDVKPDFLGYGTTEMAFWPKGNNAQFRMHREGESWTEWADVNESPIALPLFGGTVSFEFKLKDGFVSLRLAPMRDVTTVDAVVKPAGDGFYRLVTAQDGANCAWSNQFKLTGDSGVTASFPNCWTLDLSGTGTVRFEVKVDAVGYDTSDTLKSGLAFWPEGNNGSWRVYRDGKWSEWVDMSTGSEGIDFPKDMTGTIIVEFRLNHGFVTTDLGEIRNGIVPVY